MPAFTCLFVLILVRVTYSLDEADQVLLGDVNGSALERDEGKWGHCGLSLLQRRVHLLQRSSYHHEWQNAVSAMQTNATRRVESESTSRSRSRTFRHGIAATLAVYSSWGISHQLFITVGATLTVLLFFALATAWFTHSEAKNSPDRLTKDANGPTVVADEDVCHDPPQSHCAQLRWYHLAIVMGISLMDNFSTDFYVPNMPAIASELATNSFMIGLSLQINLCMRGISSLALGFLSDYFGRVRCVVVATTIYTFATLLAMSSHTITSFLAARALQGIGEGVIFVCDAIIRDAFPEAKKRMRTLAIMASLAPLAVVAAPAIGGTIGAILGWRAVFAILALNGVVLTVLAATVLPETSTPHENKSDLRDVMAQLRRILLSVPTVGLLFTFTLLASNIFSMLCNVAIVLQGTFRMGVIVSSLLIGIIPSANIIACWVVELSGRRLSSLSVTRFAMAAQWFPFAFLWGTALSTWGGALAPSIAHTISVFWCMIFVNGLCFPGLNTFYLEPFHDIAGLASGVNGLFQSLLGAWIPALGTASTVFGGVLGLQTFLGGVILVASCVFWTSFGAFPPLWAAQAHQKENYKTTSKAEAASSAQ